MSDLKSKGQVGTGKWEREKEFQGKCNLDVHKQERTRNSRELPCPFPLQLLCHIHLPAGGGTIDVWREVKLERFNIWIW